MTNGHSSAKFEIIQFELRDTPAWADHQETEIRVTDPAALGFVVPGRIDQPHVPDGRIRTTNTSANTQLDSPITSLLVG